MNFRRKVSEYKTVFSAEIGMYHDSVFASTYGIFLAKDEDALMDEVKLLSAKTDDIHSYYAMLNGIKKMRIKDEYLLDRIDKKVVVFLTQDHWDPYKKDAREVKR